MKRFTFFCLSFLFLTGTFAWSQIPVNKAYSHIVTVKTSAGSIRFVLLDETPQHRDNFLKLCQSGFYNGILFHRVIPGFVIQAGDPDTKEAMETKVYGSGSIDYKVPAEIREGSYHVRGAVAAARTADAVNPERQSSGSHFYIVQGKPATDSLINATRERLGDLPPHIETLYRNQGGTPHLDANYTIFGYVTKGMKTVDKITKYPTDKYNRPKKDVYIKNISVKKIKTKTK